MTYDGKDFRLKKFTGRPWNLIIPFDHGLSYGPIQGIHPMASPANWLNAAPISGIIAHKGFIEKLIPYTLPSHWGLIMSLNGMSSFADKPDNKELFFSARTAVLQAADAVSIQLNYTGKNDAHNLVILGKVVEQAQEYRLPVLAMLYDKQNNSQSVEKIRYLIRIACEIGVDIIKVALPSNLTDIPELLEGFTGETAIFFAGGPICSKEMLIEASLMAKQCGALGLCIGRNIFQSPDPLGLLHELSQIA